MKKSILSSLFALSLAAAMPIQSSQAGLVIGAISGNVTNGVVVGTQIGATVGGMGALVILTTCHGRGCPDFVPTFFILPIAFGLAGAILDVDAALPQDQLIQGFQKSFSFIDSHEALDSLAQMTKEKFAAETTKNPEATQVMVNFTADEVSQVLGSTDLTAEQFQTILNVLN